MGLDLDDITLDIYPDADWNGDPTTTKSHSGFWQELCGHKSGNLFPLSWRNVKQTFTASSTAEAETVSASNAIRHEAIPTQFLLEEFLGVRIPIRVFIDNTQ